MFIHPIIPVIMYISQTWFNPNQTDVWEALPGLGGAPEAPPPAILALEQIFAQKSCFPKGWHQFQLSWPLFENFLQKSPKKSANLNSIKKWLNMSKISKFCNFWAIWTCNTFKESVFHTEFNFKQKKYDWKINLFHFFSKSMLTSCFQRCVS